MNVLMVMAMAPVEHAAAMLAGRERASEGPTVRQVVGEYAPFVGRSLRYLGIGDGDVEDVAQDVFIVVCRRLADFEQRSSLKTWLYGICVRTALAHRRRASARRERLVDEPPVQSVPPPQHSDVQRKEARRQLQLILDELDEDKRAVFVLYEIERRSMKEVAEALGCPLQTAYSRHQAARRQVLAAFERQRRQEEA